ncbi:mRNA surveillance protein pelota [Candidatus Woesearchaeota archaeon]|nr:mRNA surveillance protein pelota [Candidatus Woesearchaeota archaeon]
MRIIFSDFRNGLVKLKVEDLDDLWYLSQIIDPGDVLSGHSYRKVRIESGERGQTVRKSIFVKIKAEKIDFSEQMLKVNGTVLDGPDDVPRGSYHSLNIELDTVFSIEKERFPGYQIEKLREASDSAKSDLLICIFDREEAIFALLTRKGFSVLSELHGDVSKKGEPSVKGENFYQRIIKTLSDYDLRYHTPNIIAASPSFWKDELNRELRDDVIKKKIVFATCSSVKGEAINEILGREEIKGVLKKDRVARETSLVEELLKEISKDSLAVYGFRETSETVAMGAVSVLLVADSLIRKTRQENTFNGLERVMKQADSMGADVRLIGADSEAGRKLEGLGGIAAILRYRIR